MPEKQAAKETKKIAWVSGTDLFSELDAATWLETTRVLESLGWDVTLISEGAEGSRQVNGVKVLGFSRPRIYFLGSMLLHMRILSYLWRNRNEFGIILFHQISALWLFAFRFLLRLFGKARPQFVMDTRDVPDYGSGLKHWLRVSYFNLMQRMANWWADGQTVITEKMAELVNIPPGKLLGTWPSGADIERFRAARAMRTWPDEGEPLRLIYTGKLHYERNLLQLCQAVVGANSQGMSFRFTLIGDGPQWETLSSFAQGSGGAVHVLERMSHEGIPALLGGAHIGVTPLPASNDSKFETSSPIKMFEYMAAGLPLLATRNVCHTSVVDEGTYAFWADGGSEKDLTKALNLIWQKRMTLAEMGEEAARASEDWSWEASGAKLSKALWSCLRYSQRTHSIVIPNELRSSEEESLLRD